MPTKPKLFWDVLGRDSWISYRAIGFWHVGLFGEGKLVISVGSFVETVLRGSAGCL